MTPEEIQKAIEGMLSVFERKELEAERRQIESERRHNQIEREVDKMLSVQRNLQEGQLKLQETFAIQREEMNKLLAGQRELQEAQMQLTDVVRKFIERSVTHEERIEQLIGYSITGESDTLTLEERVIALEKKIAQLESRQ